MNRFIVAMGVEMEGGWTDVPGDYPGMNWHSDGSIGGLGPDVRFAREAVSQPYQTAQALDAFIRHAQPQHVNDTCGFHVHLSLRNAGLYSLLMEKPFSPFFVAYLTEWAKKHLDGMDLARMLDRLSGRNRYCKLPSDAPVSRLHDHQSHEQGKGGYRYYHWNFCFKYKGTAECRVLPMFETAERSILGVKAIRDVVTDYLTEAVKTPDEIIETAPAPEAGEVEVVTLGDMIAD